MLSPKSDVPDPISPTAPTPQNKRNTSLIVEFLLEPYRTLKTTKKTTDPPPKKKKKKKKITIKNRRDMTWEGSDGEALLGFPRVHGALDCRRGFFIGFYRVWASIGVLGFWGFGGFRVLGFWAFGFGALGFRVSEVQGSGASG